MTPDRPLVTEEAWQWLRRHTDARIALGRAGHSVPTAAHLAFQLAHAQARDAVHLPFDARAVADAVEAIGLETVPLHSAAPDRAAYLQRPDLGRRLDEASAELLADRSTGQGAGAGAAAHDLVFVVVDGLSPLAVHRHAAALIAATVQRLQNDAAGWSIGPVAVVAQGRVAVGDPIGAGLRAHAVAVLIGERPGLSSPDSLGIYLTWAPRVGLTDASRNCISNVRPAGLSIALAAVKLHRWLTASRGRRLSGVALKDDVDDAALAPSTQDAVDGSRAGDNVLLPSPQG